MNATLVCLSGTFKSAHGLGDVEGVVVALGRGQGLRAVCRAPGDRIALARLQTAATSWAAARLSVVAAQLLDPDGEDR